jgi:hypothetical protein
VAQSKRRTPRKSGADKPRTPKDEAAQTPPNGIFVEVARGENDGEYSFAFQRFGDVTVAELPTLLGLGSKVAERQLGL